MKILCCGFFPALQRTIEYKKFRPYEVNRARTVSVSASGKATNAARVASQLGAKTTMLSFVGGSNGETLRTLLEKEPFDCRWVETSAETRICQTLLSDDHDGCTELVEEKPPLVTAEWRSFVRTFADIQQDFDRIVFSGNLPFHAPKDIYAELLAVTDGSKMLIDSSGAPLLAALDQRPAVVKLNAEELDITIQTPGEVTRPTKSRPVGPVPPPGELEEKARELIACGAGAVGITNGKEPALLVTPETTLQLDIPTIRAVNPIGSGDAVNAGTAYALAKDASLPEAFAFGLACGSSNALNAAPGHIESGQIAELASQIQITE
jgi:tagatose 6-phosphate kinase